MAKNNRRSSDSTKGRESWWSNFVPGDLTEEDKANCKNWSMWDEKQDDMLADLCDQQFKVTAKKDHRSGGYLCFIQPALEGHKYDGWLLSGRGSTPLKAIKQACYRHFALFDGDWPLVTGTEGPEDFDD